MSTQNKTFLRPITVLLICALCFGTACSWDGSDDLTPTATTLAEATAVPVPTLPPATKVKTGDTLLFGSYEQDNDTSNGKEAIQWRVLDVQDGKALLISEKGLDFQPYNTSLDNVTWENCSLRVWLNESFLNNAFSAGEQAKIAMTTVSAEKNPSFSTDPGNATNDKLFLLSCTEAEKYFATDESRKCVSTAYAKELDDFVNITGKAPDKTASGEVTCYWWLRSPGDHQRFAAYIHTNGSVYYRGYFVSLNYDAVRPAMWITLDS